MAMAMAARVVAAAGAGSRSRGGRNPSGRGPRRAAAAAHGGLAPLAGRERNPSALKAAWKEARRERFREGLRIEYTEERAAFYGKNGMARGAEDVGADESSTDEDGASQGRKQEGLGRDPYAALDSPLLLGDATVVLVSPKIPSNVGAVARLLNSFEGHELRLVKPRCDHTQRGARRGAAGALDVLLGAKIYSSFEEAVSDLDATAAYTRWTSDGDAATMPIVGSLAELHSEHWPALAEAPRAPASTSDEPGAMLPPPRLGLVFGREDAGLFQEEFTKCDAIVTVPMGRLQESLSMPTTVAIALAELFQMRQQRLGGE